MDQFGKIRRHHWKERLKISNIAKFESDTSLSSEGIAYKRLELRRRSCILLLFNKSLSNLTIILILRRSFQWCRRIFPNLSMSKVEKTREKVYPSCSFYSMRE